MDLENIKKNNPVFRQQQEGLEGDEKSPFDAPEAFEEPASVEQVAYENMPTLFQGWIDKHDEVREHLDAFEEGLIQLKKNKWVIGEELNQTFSHFFNFMDEEILPHNREEEKQLFPLLHQRLIESGEHSQVTKDGDYRTAVDILEDDHVNFIQLSSLTLNFLGLSGQLPDPASQSMVADLAFVQGQTLVEELKLHMHREEKTVFPLACQLLTPQELNTKPDNLASQNKYKS